MQSAAAVLLHGPAGWSRGSWRGRSAPPNAHARGRQQPSTSSSSSPLQERPRSFPQWKLLWPGQVHLSPLTLSLATGESRSPDVPISDWFALPGWQHHSCCWASLQQLFWGIKDALCYCRSTASVVIPFSTVSYTQRAQTPRRLFQPLKGGDTRMRFSRVGSLRSYLVCVTRSQMVSTAAREAVHISCPTPGLLPSLLKLSLIFTTDLPQKSQTPSNPRAKETSVAHPHLWSNSKVIPTGLDVTVTPSIAPSWMGHRTREIQGALPCDLH